IEIVSLMIIIEIARQKFTIMYFVIIFWFLKGFNEKILNLSKYFEKSPTKIILIYGAFYNQILLPELAYNQCSTYQPYEIKRSNTALDFDIVILHFIEHRRFMNEYIMKEPKNKKIMILLSYEPPHSVVIHFNLSLSRDYFTHWTYSYYKSSFFYYPYSDYTESNSDEFLKKKIYHEFRKRQLAALAIVSNCEFTSSVRLSYIEILKNYFQVDMYGKCFNSHISDEERINKMGQYIFFLSFENSHCEDYTTEKYWQALTSGAIPIVMGYNKYLNNLIPGSYIDVFSFSHPKHLATHLHKVLSNKEEFLKYHTWRAKYSLVEHIPQGCKILDTITKLLEMNEPEDPTIHKISNISVCLTYENSARQLIQEHNWV
ncbi:hypothetical protein MXB_3937, partial [Myxobolus squamalis]